MEAKYLTKKTLISLNKKAQAAGRNYIDPDFVELLPDLSLVLRRSVVQKAGRTHDGSAEKEFCSQEKYVVSLLYYRGGYT